MEMLGSASKLPQIVGRIRVFMTVELMAACCFKTSNRNKSLSASGVKLQGRPGPSLKGSLIRPGPLRVNALLFN